MGYAESGTCAFFYAKAIIQDAGGVNSRGFGSILRNLVVGDAYFGQNILNTSHAALFRGGEENGVVTDLGALPGHLYSRADGINSIGWVVGFSGGSAIAVTVARSSGANRRHDRHGHARRSLCTGICDQ